MCADQEYPEMYQIRTLNQANQHDWPKENREKCPMDVISTVTRVQLSLGVCLDIYLHILFLLLINSGFTTFCLCDNSFLQRQRASALSMTTGLVVKIRCSYRRDPTSISGCEPKPCFKALHATATWDQPEGPPLVPTLLLTGLLSIQGRSTLFLSQSLCTCSP